MFTELLDGETYVVPEFVDVEIVTNFCDEVIHIMVHCVSSGVYSVGLFHLFLFLCLYW